MTHETSNSFVDYYQLLGIQPDALAVDIRSAFVRLAKQQHPDAGGTLEDMQRLNEAYSTLQGSQSRKAYDLLHQFHTGTSTVSYRESGLNDVNGDSLTGMTDDEIDDFVNSVFAEYATKPPKEPIHKKVASALRFYRKKT
ncbi:J domain-containing protein [Candidatus Saccharibacteria bacterium]|nr:MAG: J domain-containing protein [Candidatus Saccharibacteria bacterium]